MNNTTFSSIAIFSILILVGAGCFGSDNTDIQANNDDNGFIGSYTDAITSGQAIKCSWSSQDGSGVTYMKKDKIYTETTLDGIKSHIIINDDCSHIWTEGESEGITICNDEIVNNDITEGFEDLTTDEVEASAPEGTEVNCEKQNISDSQFNPPSNINFINPLESLTDL